ncbi:FAD-binding oxidoreductase, partial [Salmonella enterica subsp. enterica serovar Haifa]|nr:FAD-binding oxidoreductase [Salmonella enterica subsp. enterica serovar Haifa]
MSVVALLQEALGALVDTHEGTREQARSDRSGHAAVGRPLAIVHAERVEHVQQTLRIATATRTP